MRLTGCRCRQIGRILGPTERKPHGVTHVPVKFALGIGGVDNVGANLKGPVDDLVTGNLLFVVDPKRGYDVERGWLSGGCGAEQSGEPRTRGL